MRFLLLLVVLCFSLLNTTPAWGAIAQPEQLPLTLELLQQRTKNLSAIDGVATVDLRRLVIDLRPENGVFREQFYRLIKGQLQRSGNPVALDLSYSRILGEFSLGELGPQAPLYGDALPPLFSQGEQAQLRRDRRRLAQFSQLSRSLLIQEQRPTLQLTVLRGTLKLVQTRFEGFANFANTFFLSRVEVQGAEFGSDADWSETRFSQPSSFAGARFWRDAQFRNAIFFDRAGFNQAQFQTVRFQGSEFQSTANFSRAQFQEVANFSRCTFQGNADFAQTRWWAMASFNQSKFRQALFLSEARFEQTITFREAQFQQPVNLRGAAILDQVDWGDAGFAPGVYLNVADLQVNPDEAKLLGNPGELGRVLSVPTLQGNETLLRNLSRSFRSLEQIPDVNRLEYLRERLRLQQIRQRLVGVNLNTASPLKLTRVGFSPAQAAAISAMRNSAGTAQSRANQPFRSRNDLLKIEGVDLSTYVRMRDRIVAAPPRTPVSWSGDALKLLSLSVLLLLTRYGTSAGLALGVGLVAIAYFAVVFWVVDRLRRLTPQPIVPPREESFWMAGGVGTLLIFGLTAVFRSADQPWLTLLCLSVIIIPIPAALLTVLYLQGRFHDRMEESYLVEDGSMRQLRILIGRLPNIPKFPLFRDRYTPIPWDRRWNWLNYLDFSLNNLLKVGFNDIRLRDEFVPGTITALAWYQWSLGLLYIALLLWTLSRTIPGLNLLIYLK